MKRPYKLAILTTTLLTIYSSIQCMLNFPDWFLTALVGLGEVIFALYLAAKDGEISDDLIEKMLFAIILLSLVLTYPKIIYEMWKDREEIKKKIRGE